MEFRIKNIVLIGIWPTGSLWDLAVGIDITVVSGVGTEEEENRPAQISFL